MIPISDHDLNHGDPVLAVVSSNATNDSLVAADPLTTPYAGNSSVTFISLHRSISALDSLLEEIPSINEGDNDDRDYFLDGSSHKTTTIANPSEIQLLSQSEPIIPYDYHTHPSTAIQSRQKITIRPR
jgi:hypothetical protein